MLRNSIFPPLLLKPTHHWCTIDELTREKLELLKKRGLKGILISVNPFYLEYVPFERTERATRIDQEVFGNNLVVYQLEYYRRFKEAGIRGRVALEDYFRLDARDSFVKNVEFFIMGRAAYTLKGKFGELFPRHSASYFFSQPCRPSFLRNWHNHFDNYGNYVPGYCGGISLGDGGELDNLLEEGIETKEYPILGFLIDEDLEGLFRFSKDLGYQERQEGYLSKCHLCMDMRKYLAGREEFRELKPREFYLHLD